MGGGLGRLYMNSASIAETHRFGRVRRNGYDPAEVDAVIARLVDALRHSDERINILTEKIDAADESADAIRKTFVAAQSTRDEIVESARQEASTITESAMVEAKELAATAEELQAEIAASRDRILAGLYEDAEQRSVEIERQTAQRTVEAEWAVREAIQARDRRVSDTEADAASIAHKADLDAAQIRVRIATMSQAALAFEKAAETLAVAAKERAKVIDLTAMEHVDQSQVMTPAQDDVVEPEPVIHDEPLLVVTDPAEDASEELEDFAQEDENATEPTDVSVDENEEPEDPVGDPAEEDESQQTRYQRSTGVPLKERIKIARMSG